MIFYGNVPSINLPEHKPKSHVIQSIIIDDWYNLAKGIFITTRSSTVKFKKKKYYIKMSCILLFEATIQPLFKNNKATKYSKFKYGGKNTPKIKIFLWKYNNKPNSVNTSYYVIFALTHFGARTWYSLKK